ncbi:hypothetical protein [Mesorhizobium sp. M0715]|uniref:hypothetical protein n=1 Tax=Mesorhizobium sp. M0715 TaxID=2956990 RepID=UPI00333988CE
MIEQLALGLGDRLAGAWGFDDAWSSPIMRAHRHQRYRILLLDVAAAMASGVVGKEEFEPIVLYPGAPFPGG